MKFAVIFKQEQIAEERLEVEVKDEETLLEVLDEVEAELRRQRCDSLDDAWLLLKQKGLTVTCNDSEWGWEGEVPEYSDHWQI